MDLYNVDSYGNPDYGQDLNIQLEGIMSAHSQIRQTSEGLQVQMRNLKGQYSTNLISGSKYVEEVKQALDTAVREALLKNYEHLIKGLSEPTGTLKKAVEQGQFIDEDSLESYRLLFKLASLQRDRERPWGGIGNTDSTDHYGPIVFAGRGPITTFSPMVVPLYGGGGEGDKIQPYQYMHTVGSAAAENIFALTPEQKREVARSILRPLKEIVADQLKQMTGST